MSNDRFHNIAEAERLFALQHTDANLQLAKETSVKERIARIRKIERYLLDEKHQQEWTEALWHDLHKCREEAIATELLPVLACMKHIYDELHTWVKDRPTGVPLALAGLKAFVRHEPKGHVLVIAPWNYPLQLAINPLIHAIAAGNVALLKPSEVAAHTSAFLKKMIGDLFEEREVAVVEGDVPTTTALLAKPWHHIFFTGSPAVGKVVMKAASEHLTSVTLELGGKSPVIVDDTYDAARAAEKITWGKCVNAGQTCIAPDYLLIHQSRLEPFLKAFAERVERMYDPQGKGVRASQEYGRIINTRNFHRVKGLIDDAVAKGARLAIGGELVEEEKFIAPHVLIDVTADMAIMREEIFGPALPVITFTDLKEVPSLIARLERPLALYIMSNSRRNTEYLLHNTTAGGTAINDVMVTSVNPLLPFGGINNSGIGKSNGHHGFIEFSNERGVLKRSWGTLSILFPPYKPTLVKWAARIARI
jgi:aldehyde dehydrogenase (NAD+)